MQFDLGEGRSGGFSAARGWAIDFPNACTVVGDEGSVHVAIPSVTNSNSSSAFRKFHRRLFPSSSFAAEHQQHVQRGYFARANQCFAALAPSGAPLAAGGKSQWTLLCVDPLSAATADEENEAESCESGDCTIARAVSFAGIIAPPATNTDGGSGTAAAGALALLQVVPIGGLSALLLCARAGSAKGSDGAGELHVGCVGNLPALFSTQRRDAAGKSGGAVAPLREGIDAAEFVEWITVAVPHDAAVEAGLGRASIEWWDITKSKVAVAFKPNGSGSADAVVVLVVEQNSLTEKITATVHVAGSNNGGAQDASAGAAPQPPAQPQLVALGPAAAVAAGGVATAAAPLLRLRADAYRQMSEECCICLMPLLPTEDDPDTMPGVAMLGCGHGFHRGCMAMDLKRADDFIADGRYCRFRRLGCITCKGSMRDALRFPELEWLFGMRGKVEALAKAIDAQQRQQQAAAQQSAGQQPAAAAAVAASAHGSDDAESVDERMERSLFYTCCKCKQPYFGGPKDCPLLLSDPKTKPENLVCDACCTDFSCAQHGRAAVVYKCHMCWGVAKSGFRFLGRLRLCAGCVSQVKVFPPDTVRSEAVAVEGAAAIAAPAGTPFAGVQFAVAGHDAEGAGLSVAGCSACNPRLGESQQ